VFEFYNAKKKEGMHPIFECLDYIIQIGEKLFFLSQNRRKFVSYSI